MKRKGLILIAVLAVVLAAMQIVVIMGTAPAKNAKENVKVVKAPEQKEAMENELFKVEEYVAPKIDGTNVALKGTATDNGYTDVYPAANAIDGRRESASYWEGGTDGPSRITVKLKKEYNIHTIRIGLCPDTIWGPRTQTLSVKTSDDGKNWKDLVPEKDYDFDPKTGNEIVLKDFGTVKTQYVQVEITKNTGANAGQIAELEIYSNDK
ncbi:MAG: discoidin domain-containing protein [Eubacterium sp.]|nr:discoidin domain-containing protein [Eubacterium sp.]